MSDREHTITQLAYIKRHLIDEVPFVYFIIWRFFMNEHAKQPCLTGLPEGVPDTFGITQSSGYDRHAVCAPYQNVVGSLCHGDEKGISNQYVGQDKCIIQPSDVAVFGQSQFGGYRQGCTTLRAQGGDNGGGSENLVAVSSASTTKLIRRLTPLECERLQGFPDGWTKIPKASDSARYKALGNSVAIPCVEFLMQRVACFLSQDKEEETCTSTPTT